MPSENSDQTARRQIWIFAGRTCPKVRFLSVCHIWLTAQQPTQLSLHDLHVLFHQFSHFCCFWKFYVLSCEKVSFWKLFYYNVSTFIYLWNLWKYTFSPAVRIGMVRVYMRKWRVRHMAQPFVLHSWLQITRFHVRCRPRSAYRCLALTIARWPSWGEVFLWQVRRPLVLD